MKTVAFKASPAPQHYKCSGAGYVLTSTNLDALKLIIDPKKVGYYYKIKPQPLGVDVNKLFPNSKHYTEFEVAVPFKIQLNDIVMPKGK